jgi:hypothetical protein
LKNQIKLIACLVVAALILSFLSFPTHAEKDSAKLLGAAAAPQSLDSRVGVQDEVPVTGQLVQNRANDPELSRHFRNYDLIRINPDLAAASVKSSGRLSLKTSKRDFDMKFVPYDMRAPDYTAQEIGADGVAHKLPKTAVNTFKGSVKGDPRAQARMSVGAKGLEGAIITDSEQFYLQPARALSKSARADEFVFYSAEDVAETDASCGVTLAEEVAAREELTHEQHKGEIEAEFSSPITALSPMKVVRIATDADAEYVAAAGGTAQGAINQINSIINMVDAIYQLEMGVKFEIGFQNNWADQATTDPYTTTAPSALLTEFRNYWNANFPASNPTYSRQLAHLWTGKDLDGSVIGIASVAVVCRTPTSAYGLSQRFPTSGGVDARTAILTAHEIGHNFSAAHTNQATTEVPPDFDVSCDNSIMEAGLGSATNSSFCTFSRSQIVGHANAYGFCLTVGSAPPANNCNEVPIDGTLTGTLSNTDCRSTQRGADFFADQYSFNGVAGQQVSITVVHDPASVNLDPYLFLIGPDGTPVGQDDDGAGNQDSRIPGSGLTTLPLTGKYVIEVTSFGGQQTGNYTVTRTLGSCSLSASPPSQQFSAAGGNGQITVTASGSGCTSYQFTNRPNTAAWLTPLITGGFGSQTLNFQVQANSSTAGRTAFLVVAPSVDNFLEGGLIIPVAQSGTGPDCSVTPIGFGQTINGTIALSDCESPIRGVGYRADRYSFTSSAGQQVAISVNGGGIVDTFVNLIGPNGVVLLNDDDGGGNFSSRIPGGTGMLPLGIAGTYIIEVTAFDAGATGNYSLTLTSGAASPTVQFSQPTYSIGEADTSLTATVTRSGDLSGTATVDYATSDSYAECNVMNGQASAKCDYSTSAGTLRFAAGETSKTISVSIIDDGYVEGNETLTLSLSNATGMSLGSPTTTTITIVDNDTTASNSFDSNPFIVRQQYLDFLLREPDPGGFNDWLTVLTNCNPGQGGLGSPPGCDRVHVSSGFFRSTEFGERGYWIYRFYHGALGRRPQFAEFTPDMRRLSGFLSASEQEAARAAFVADFMARPEFTAIYGGLTTAGTAAQFIAKLEEKAQVTLPATVPPTQPGQPPQYGRAELIQKMASGEFTAAQTLRAFIEQKVVFDAFFYRAFVAMQYFGYLLRDPEPAGYDDWVDVLTNGRGTIAPGDFRHLIFGFFYSVEYRKRFGP